MILDFLYGPHFWANYFIIAALFVPVFWVVQVQSNWAEEYNKDAKKDDPPAEVILIVATLLLAAIWPLTLVGFVTSRLLSLRERAKGFFSEVAKEAKARAEQKQEPIIRCYRCNAVIKVSDSFCSTCGADQTAMKEDKKE